MAISDDIKNKIINNLLAELSMSSGFKEELTRRLLQGKASELPKSLSFRGETHHIEQLVEQYYQTIGRIILNGAERLKEANKSIARLSQTARQEKLELPSPVPLSPSVSAPSGEQPATDANTSQAIRKIRATVRNRYLKQMGEAMLKDYEQQAKQHARQMEAAERESSPQYQIGEYRKTLQFRNSREIGESIYSIYEKQIQDAEKAVRRRVEAEEREAKKRAAQLERESSPQAQTRKYRQSYDRRNLAAIGSSALDEFERQTRAYNKFLVERARENSPEQLLRKFRGSLQFRYSKSIGEDIYREYERQGREFEKYQQERVRSSLPENVVRRFRTSTQFRYSRSIGEEIYRRYEQQEREFVRLQRERLESMLPENIIRRFKSSPQFQYAKSIGEEIYREYERQGREYGRQEIARARKEASQQYRRSISFEDTIDRGPERDTGSKPVYDEALLSRSLPGGVPTTKRLAEIIGRSSFTYEDLKRVTQNQPTGVFDLSFERTDEQGVIQKMMVSVDKYGGILSRVRRQQQAFGEAVARDALEFVKWSVAIGLVLGPLQKLTELSQKAIENQTRLVDVTIAMGDAQKSTSEIFNNAYRIAQQSGENVEGVIDAFSLAYRAAGGAAGAETRFSDASKLLSDSLILSKLSTLEQAEAIDILSAALKQTGTSFQDGTVLLDKWVAVSKVANIDLASLATGFAVMGETADAAGLNVDELNSLLAITAESGIASGKELANMGRRLVGAFQSDTARKELLSLGIAIQDTQGNMRTLTDIAEEINELRDSGALGKEAFSDLTLALGGGVRGQALFASFFSAFEKFDTIKAASQNAQGGEAVKALGQQLETAATASTRLGNAFSQLAQSIGSKGGLLDIFTATLNVATQIVETFAGLTSTIGRTTPALAALFATLAFNKYYLSQRPELLSRIKGDLGSTVAGGTTWLLNNSSIADSYFRRKSGLTGITPSGVGLATGKFFENNMTNMLGVAGVGFSVANNLLDKNASSGEKTTRVAADIVGGIIGGFVGGPAGAVIGSSIAEGFVNATLLYEPEFAKFFVSAFSNTQAGASDSREGRENAFQNRVFELAGSNLLFGDGAFGGLGGKNNAVILSSLLNLAGMKTTTEDVGLLLATRFGTDQNAIRELASLNPNNIEATRPSARRDVSRIEDFSAYQTAFSQDALSKLIKGDLTPSAYNKQLEFINKLSTSGNELYQNIGGQVEKKTLANVLAFSSEEERNYLISLNSEMNDLFDTMQNSSEGTSTYNDALKRYNELSSQAVAYTNELNTAILSKKPLNEILDLSKYSEETITQLIQRARAIQEAEYSVSGFTKEEYAAKVASFDPFRYEAKEGYSREETRGLDSRYIQDAIREGMEDGTIPGVGLGFQTYDISRQEFENAMAGYNPLLQQLEQFGYAEDSSSQISIFKDGVVEPMKKDWKIVQYLLGEILKTNEKQLEGLYNFPGGITALVPWDAALLGRRDDAQTGNTPIVSNFPDESLREEDRYPTTLRRYPWANWRTEGQPWKFPNYDVTRTSTGGILDRSGGTQKLGESLWSVLERQFDMAKGQAARVAGGLWRNPILNKGLDAIGVPNLPNATSSFGLAAANMLSAANKNLQAKLSLAIENKTTILLDGRTLANVVKRYMRDDLVRLGNAGGSVTRVNIV